MQRISVLIIATLMASFTVLAAPQVGQSAPTFKLQDQNGDWHALKDYRGQWLAVYFYPKDETPGCTTEACNFRDNIYLFKKIGAAVVGISLDDVDSHKAFTEKHKLPFTLLADTGGEVAKTYGVLRDYKAIQYANRESFLVNPDGVIVKHYAKVNPKDHTQEVVADLKKLMAEYKS